MYSRFLLLFLILSSFLYSQSEPSNSSEPISSIQTKVRVVLVDVVVTNGSQSVTDLRKKDFEIYEDGVPQKVVSFEEHKAAPITQIKLPPMPPGVYTNFPAFQASDSVNVLLLDALNTQTRDQAFVHSQMLKYLKTIPPGTRVAIFTLASRLRMVQGVTTDTSQLLAVLNDKKGGASGPHPSALLPSEVEQQADQHTIEFMQTESMAPAETDPYSAQQAISPIDAMKQFMADTASFQTETRTRITLLSLQQLARYTSDIPGRKNIIWFSGSFPTGILPDPDSPDPFSSIKDLNAEVHKTADILAANQVAIYPIGAQGLATDVVYEANGAEISQVRPSVMNRNNVKQMRSEIGDKASGQAAMETLAKETGGKAFYDSNGLGDALMQAINNGANYYSISYSPINKTMNGKYRKIEIKIVDSKYKLSYRHGYFAEDPDNKQTAEQDDPLYSLMGVNLPNMSQILYKVRLLPSDPQPAADAPFLGSNTDHKGPYTRFSADFAIAVQDLKLNLTPDGVRHGDIEIMMVAYDHLGKPLNMIIKRAGIVLKPDVYKSMQKVGLQIKSEIDVPQSDVLLRTGIFDLDGNEAGTLTVPLSHATMQAQNKAH